MEVGFIETGGVSALNSLKEAIHEDPQAVLSTCNTVQSNPCDWSGIWVLCISRSCYKNVRNKLTIYC